GERRGGKRDVEYRCRQVDGRVEPGEERVRRNDTVAHHQHRLDETGEARSRLEMPHVRLQGADPAGATSRVAVAEDRPDRIRLERVAAPGPRSVRPDGGDVVGFQPSPAQRGPE